MTISEEFSDRQNSLSINLMMKWESKYLSFSSSSADITAMAIIATTQVEVARMGTIEVMGLIEPDTVVKKSKEIPIIAIGTACDGIDILHIPRDKITDNGLQHGTIPLLRSFCPLADYLPVPVTFTLLNFVKLVGVDIQIILEVILFCPGFNAAYLEVIVYFHVE